jgi:nucleoid-associated protein YgaU
MSLPEDRYVKLETKTLPNGRVVYRSARPLPIDPGPNDLSFTANERDRMDIIAHNAYGSPVEWWRIAAANRISKGSALIPPGTTVVIPSK